MKRRKYMNQYDVRLLLQISGYPCVTITLPTHRTSPENRQDQVRLKNLITETTDRLLEEFNKRDVDGLLKRLENLTDTIDFRSTLDGLALFVNQDFERAFRIPFQIPERVIIGESFFTRDLVHALNHSARYWVLALSEKPTRLYEGYDHHLTEIEERGFPMIHEGPGGEAPLPGGFGIRRSAHRDERHRQFFRKVDDTLKPFLADDPLPLIVVGVDRYHAFFNEVSAHTIAVVGRITGSYDKTSSHELGKLVQPLVDKYRDEKRKEALEQLERAVGERKFVSTIGEVWRLANEGRGDILLVEEDLHYPGRMDDNGVLVRADDPAAPNVMDDAVDEIIETVLNKQGRVVFVENGQLEKHRRIAMVLRF
jgi:hypothetical protein